MRTMPSVSRFVENIRKIEEESRKTNEGIADQSTILNNKLGEVREGISNQSAILNDKLGEVREGISNQSTILNDRLGEVREGISNQSTILNDKLGEVREGITNQSTILNDKLIEVREGITNQSLILNDKLTEIVESLINEQSNINKVEEMCGFIREGINNQSTLLNQKLEEIIKGSINEQRIINDNMSRLINKSENQQTKMNDTLSHILRKLTDMTDNLTVQQLQLRHTMSYIADSLDRPPKNGLATGSAAVRGPIEEIERGPDGKPRIAQTLRSLPLQRAPKTYNTDHPDYDPAHVRNFPGTLCNSDKPNANPALRAVRQIMQASARNERAWQDQLEMTLAEVKGIPGASQLFERKESAQCFFSEINQRYESHYEPGWMNVDDALFLYWLVRRLRPRIVVETGICNGFSAALLLLALAKNGNEGTLHAVGRAEIFDARDRRWTERGKVFGEVVVGGEKLGWMIPDIYRHRVQLYAGDAETLLPELIDKLDSVDFFFHDSDHTYGHMMFEFHQAKRKLSSRGIVVADNIAWNSSLWEFADDCGVPAYNFRGSVGAAFFG
jgi:predicted O-methyltransferase YrrM